MQPHDYWYSDVTNPTDRRTTETLKSPLHATVGAYLDNGRPDIILT